jgi:hypothetical protein
MTLHPQRCETCDYKGRDVPFKFSCPLHNSAWSDYDIKFITKLIMQIGCATHSPTQNEREGLPSSTEGLPQHQGIEKAYRLELSPYKCDETCTFFERKKDDAGREYLHCKIGINLHYSWRMTAAYMGCASHSSHPTSSEQEIRKDERIDVAISKLQEFLKISETKEEARTYQFCLDILAELRSKQGERG